MIAALRSDPYLRAPGRPRRTPPARPASPATSNWQVLRPRRLESSGKQANEITAESDDAALHEVRKTAKKARYAAELAEPVAARAARFVKQALPSRTWSASTRTPSSPKSACGLAATRSGSSLLAAGRLIERERTRRAEARAAFPKAWRRLEKAGKAAWS